MQQDVVLRFSSDREDFKGTLRSFMSPPDLVKFERTFPREQRDQERKVETILWLVWAAYRREVDPEGPEFDAFVEDLSDFEIGQDDAADPTEEQPPA